jgi:hypothetical protein
MATRGTGFISCLQFAQGSRGRIMRVAQSRDHARLSTCGAEGPAKLARASVRPFHFKCGGFLLTPSPRAPRGAKGGREAKGDAAARPAITQPGPGPWLRCARLRVNRAAGPGPGRLRCAGHSAASRTPAHGEQPVSNFPKLEVSATQRGLSSQSA